MSGTATYTVENVDPATARTWLGYNTSNRHVSQRIVDAYARDMSAGDWLLRGDAIEFSDNPAVLLNGQHRLHAIVKSGCTVPLLVGRGVPRAVQDITDSLRKRSFADQLSLRGEKNSVVVQSIVRRGYMYDRGVIGNSGGAFTPTLPEMREWFERNEEQVRAAAQYADAVRRETGLVSSVGGLSYIVFRRIDHATADQFMQDLRDGAGLHAGHPVLALRKRLYDVTTRSGRVPEHELLALVFMTWNHVRQGNSVTKLQLPKGGLTSKTFPLPR